MRQKICLTKNNGLLNVIFRDNLYVLVLNHSYICQNTKVNLKKAVLLELANIEIFIMNIESLQSTL